MSAHTPGPWHVEHPYGEPGVYVGGPNTELVAKLYGGSTPDEANARLIAAAPELLAACKGALLDLENRASYDESNRLPKLHGQENYWMRSHIAGTRAIANEIRAAIAKAEGVK